MFKNTLIIAGLLSVMSLSAQASDRIILDQNMTINGASDYNIISNEINDYINDGVIINKNGYDLTITGNVSNNTVINSNNVDKAIFGGGVRQTGGTLTLNNGVSFSNNTIQSKNQPYPGTDYYDTPAGAAIFIEGNGTLNASGTVTFDSNKIKGFEEADGGCGGAIFAQGAKELNFENVVFNANSAATYGGAVYNGDSVVTISGNGTFTGNSSGSGGAIFSYNATGKKDGTVTNTGTGSTFRDNTATEDGGAITNWDGTINIGQNSSFSGNHANERGGAIYNSGSSSNISVVNVTGGTSFTGNSAGGNGGAIFNKENINLNTTAGNIVFSGNTAKSGADVYLDGDGSRLVIDGTNANNKVSFGSNGSIAGNGSIIQQSDGTVEFKDNQNVDGFTGTYTQTKGKTSLNNSKMFNKYTISTGELELLNGSTATIDNTNRIFNGSKLTIGGTSANQSVLNIGTSSDTVSIAQSVAVNLQEGGKLNIANGSVVLNASKARDVLSDGDNWQGDINNTTGGTLTLDGFSHDTATGSYTQNGGSLVLQNSSELSLADSASSITGGTVDIQDGNTLNISNGASIGGSTTTTAAGELNIGNNGSVTGGTTNVSGTMNVNNGGTVSGGTTKVTGTMNVAGSVIGGTTDVSGTMNVNDGGIVSGGTTNIGTTDGNGTLTVANGGTISGGTTNVNTGSTLNVSGNINGSANTTIASGATVNVNGGTINSTGTTNIKSGSTLNITNNGNVTLYEGDTWAGSIVNTGSNLTLNGVIHDTVNGSYSQNNGNLSLTNNSKMTLNEGSSITGGSIDVDNSIFNIASGGTITDGEISIGDGSTFSMAQGATMTGGKIEFTGESGTGTLGINGVIGRDAVFDAVSNIVSIGTTGDVTLNQDATTGDTWTDGTIALDGGTLTFEGTNNGSNGKFVGREGNLNISSGSQEFVVAENSLIKNKVITKVDAGSTIAVTGGQASFSNDDTINGSLKVTDGILNLNNVTKGEKFTQTGGTTNVTGTFALNNTNDSVAGGTFNIGDTTAAAVNQSNGVIAQAANVNIAANSTLNMTGGTTTLNGGEENADNWLGTVQLDGGTLNLVDLTSNGVLKADSGVLNVNDQSNIIITGDSYIKDLTQLTLDGNMTVSNSNEGAGVTIGSTSTWNGQITLENGGNLTYQGGTASNGAFLGNDGNLTINSPSQDFVVADGSYINSDVNTVINSGSTVAVTGGQASFSDADTINGSLSISNGILNLNNVTKGEKFTQTGGTANVTGTFALDNTNDSVAGGTFNIGNDTTAAAVNQSNGVIAQAANVNIAANSTLNMTGGTTTLNGGEENADNWLGTVQLGGGTLNINDFENNGTLIADGGTLNLANSNLTILADSSIGKNTVVSFDNTNSMTINGGSVAFDGTEWGGSVTLDKGTLDYRGTSNGALLGNDGRLNTYEESNLSIDTGSYINEDVIANLAGNLTINGTDAENGGRVDLGDGDTVTGNITINNFGTLNMADNLQMADSGQTITFNGANAIMNLNGNNNLDLKAEITGSAGEINKNGYGNVIFSGTTGNYKGNLTINNSGDLTFVDENGFGGNLIFGDIDGKNIGIIADKIIGSTTLERDANITYSTYRDVDLTFGDSVSVAKGSITAKARAGQNVIFDQQAIATENGKINASGQNVTFTNGAKISDNAKLSVTAIEKASMNDVTATDSTIITAANTTEFNTLNLANSNAFILQNGFNSQSINFDGTSGINVMNGVVTDNNMGNVNITDGSTANYSIDIAPRWWSSDKFIAGSVSTDGTATVNISDFQFIDKAPIDRFISLKLFDVANPMENILFTATDKEIFTPIGYYKLFSQGNNNGNYTATLTRYNDQVFRGQVATVANWQNQQVVNNVLFDHTQQINMQYLAQQNPNLYAAASPLFAPYQYNRKDGSLWFKSFGTFEKLSMTRDLNVDNNFYGALVGADFPAIDLKKGWSLLPTAYIGYTGAHQRYANVGMYQNGGQGGAMATLMKKDFIGSLLVYGGGYGNTMDVRGYSDETANWFVGSAAKAAYNFHPTKRFIVQPNLLASYTMFGEQKWYTGYGDMTMYSKMLNGVNVAPGLNLIYGRETWSIYATVQYFYNILGYDAGYAGHVSLPSVGMRHGYLEYGFGLTKTWKDRFSAYAQFVIRNAGRTGVGVQGGLMYKL